MEINQYTGQAVVDFLFVSLNKQFDDTFKLYKPLYTKVGTVVPSKSRTEIYNWMGNIEKMREWLGERVINNLKRYQWTIDNKDWEDTIEVERNDVEDDMLGMIGNDAKNLGYAAASHPDELIFDLMLGGFANLCFDGTPFFNDSHPLGPNGLLQSNLGHGALNEANYAAARAQMMSLVDEAGRPLNLVPDLLITGPALEGMARSILMPGLTAATTRDWVGTAEYLVVPMLSTNPNAWYLIDTKRPMKPFIYQTRKPLQFVQMNKPTDYPVFMNKKFIFGCDCRDNAGYGLWPLCYGSDGTA